MARIIDAVISLKDNFSAQMEQATKSMTKFQKQAQRLGRDIVRQGRDIQRFGESMTKAITLPVVAAGVAATKMAMDAVESENLFEVSMGKMANSARQWSEQMSKSLGLNAYEVRKNVGTYNAMLTSMGMTEKQALNMSESMTKLAYDMASFYNLKPDEAFYKLRAGISGEAEPLKRLGILINDTTIQQYAWTHGIAKHGQKLTEQQKVLARYGAIMEQTKKAQGDLARTMNSPTNQLRIMKSQLQETAIKFGLVLIPFLQKGLQIIKPWIDRLSNMNEKQRESVVRILMFAAAAGPVIKVLGVVYTGVGKGILMYSKFAKTVKMTGSIFKAAMTMIFSPANMVFLAIVAIAVAAFLIIKYWKPIKKFFVDLWNGIYSKFHVQIDAIVAGFKKGFSFIASVFRTLFAVAKGVFSIIAVVVAMYIKIYITIISKFISIAIKIWDKIKSPVEKVFSFIGKIIKGSINLWIGFINLLIRGINKINFKVPNWVPGMGGKQVGFNVPEIPKFAKGTNYFSGGPAIVGENGPELVYLPRGSRVISNDKTEKILHDKKTSDLNITIAKLADTIIVREEADIDKITNKLVKKIKKEAFNMA